MMNEVKTIIFSWLSTAKGGAEESTLSTCKSVNDNYSTLKAKVLLWEVFDSKETYPEFVVICKNSDDYIAALKQLLSESPANTVLFSNHRTYQTDIPIAIQNNVKFCIIFRAIPLQNEAFRTTNLERPDTLVYQNALTLNWTLLSKAVCLIGVSHFCANKISEVAPPRINIRCVYNGLSAKYFQNEIRFALKSDVQKILIASRLSKWKSIDVGIKAFALALKTNPSIELYIAGIGEEERLLKELVSDLKINHYVKFLGFQNDMVSLYNQCDYLLHTCPLESFGRTIVEASASGVITIAPQNGGTGELIIHKQTGFTYHSGSVENCAEMLIYACKLSPEEYSNIARMASQRVNSIFTLNRVVEDYVGIANFALNS